MEYKIAVIGEDSFAKSWLAREMTQETSWTEESLVELCPYKSGYVAENEITDEAFRNQVPVKVELKTREYRVKIIDTTGLDNYPGIYEKHLRTASGFCLVFNPSDRDSVANIETYWAEIRLIRKTKDFPVIFIAHTDTATEDGSADVDLSQHRRMLHRVTRRFGVPVVETSPEVAFCVQEAFLKLMREVIKQTPKPPPPRKRLMRRGVCTIV